jgi:hypothetical protein
MQGNGSCEEIDDPDFEYTVRRGTGRAGSAAGRTPRHVVR